MNDYDLTDALCRNLAGKPASACGWREMLHVRDVVADLLNREANRRQSSDLPAASQPPCARSGANGVNGSEAADVATGRAGTEGVERGISSRDDAPAPKPPGLDGHMTASRPGAPHRHGIEDR